MMPRRVPSFSHAGLQKTHDLAPCSCAESEGPSPRQTISPRVCRVDCANQTIGGVSAVEYRRRALQRTDADFAKFLTQSLSSLMELEYHLLFARDEGLIAGSVFDAFEADIEVLRRTLIAFIKRLRP